MTPAERRASLSLAGIFALRMLGLFLVLPVFALEAARLPGGNDPALVGLAMGIYGLTQAVMQVPLGLASDRVGRKKIIVIGLIVFALGSVVAALAGSVQMLVVGRAIQGAGAVSAAVTALLADLTRDEVRTKGMALVGISIAAMFALSLVAAPPLAGAVGLGGLFWITAALAVAGIAVVLWWTPAEPVQHADAPRGRLADVWLHPHLWRLDLGVFVLHTVQMAMWVVVPGLLVQAGLQKAQHWHVYLPAVLASFVMLGGLFAAERRGQLRAVLRFGIALLFVVQVALWLLAPRAPGLWTLGALMFFFFIAFNILEATQPSLISRLAPAHARGAALGVYNTLQSLGLFAGGALGGWLVKAGGPQAVLVATSALALLWLLLGWAQAVPARPAAAPAS
ncbi:MFS transporter [Ottowia testudinis]|uniref:MFS transporter n=1 Tax=Ottowia testudinis TaxID=2816950 RepID=A0A975CK41_9BURK|nr:MFS transporter [Ottowia testudinis]QTD45659.1 MFS transporter [Ottowia testudinis]